MSSITNPLTGAAANSAGATSASSSSNNIANQTTFLQLLVAQLKNQDPSQPVQGTEFVTELAQFNDVEQNLGMRQDLDALSQKFLGTVPSGGTGSAASSGTSGRTGTTAGTTGA